MSMHNYENATVEGINAILTNSVSMIENAVPQNGDMAYSWDEGIVGTVVKWFEVQYVCLAYDRLRGLFQLGLEQFNGSDISAVESIKTLDATAAIRLESPVTLLEAIAEKMRTCASQSQKDISVPGAFDSLKEADYWIDKKYNTTLDVDKMTDEEKERYYKYLSSLDPEHLSESDKENLQKYLDYLSSKNIEIKAEMTDEEKKNVEQFNVLYGKLHQDEEDAINTFFKNSEHDNGFTEKEINDIKYLAYTSEEPYHKLIFDNIGKISIEGFHGSNNDPNGCGYRPGTGRIVLGADHNWNNFGMYHSFFEEIGHAIDDIVINGPDELYLSEENKSELHSAIIADIRENIGTFSEERARNVVDNYLKKHDSMGQRIFVDKEKVIRALSGQSSELLNGVEMIVFIDCGNTLNGAINTVDDTYGAILGKNWGHDWDKDYDNDLIYTELFSQYIANGVTNNQEDGHSRKYLPRTYAVLDRIVAEYIEQHK